MYPKCVKFLDVIVNDTEKIFNCLLLLLIYGNTSDFCILTLNPENLLNSLICFGNFLVGCIRFSA